MKICVIHGSPRKGNTRKAAEIIMNRLTAIEGEDAVDFTEFFLPKDMPHFCLGCCNCFLKGIEKCPHYSFTGPILEAMLEADGVIMTSPVYCMSESAQIKALLDHYGSIYIPHRPRDEMFSKIGLVVSSTAGGGTGKAISTIKRNLKYWGFRRVKGAGFALHELSWDDMPEKKRIRIAKRLENAADGFGRLVNKRQRLRSGIFTRFWFFVMKKLISAYEDDNLDKQYWSEKGWFTGLKRPYQA